MEKHNHNQDHMHESHHKHNNHDHVHGFHHSHNHNPKEYGKSLLVIILLNLIITIAEYIGGIISGSLGLVSDATHNLSDVLSLILGFFGEKISSRKASKKHSFGLKRFEILTALINGLLLWGIAIFIIIEAFRRFKNPVNISIELMLIIAFIGLFGNLFSVLILNKDKSHNLNMKAAYLHLFYDTISSVAIIIIGIIIYFTNFLFLDLLISILISIMIIFSGFDVIKKSFNIFMQGVPEHLNFDEIHNTLLKIKGVKSVHDIHIWAIDSNEVFLSCHVCLDKNIRKSKSNINNKKNNNMNDNNNADLILHNINHELKEKFNIDHTTIQTENNQMCKNEHICTR